MVDKLSYPEVAKKHCVTPTLVGKLIREAKKMPEKLRERKQKEKLRKQAKDVVGEITKDMLEKSLPITKASQIQLKALELHGIEINNLQVRQILKKELGLGYRTVKNVPMQSNSERCLVLRQQYALKMLELLGEGKHIINVDERWINEANFTRKMWAPYGSTGTLTSQIVAPRLALIAALDTDGIVYLSLTQTTSDSDILMLFFRYLIRHLDNERPNWRSDTIFLLDGARYHTGEEMREYFQKMEVTIIFSGP